MATYTASLEGIVSWAVVVRLLWQVALDGGGQISKTALRYALSLFKLFMELGCLILIRVVIIRSRFRGRVHANRSVNTTTKTRSDYHDPYKDQTAQLHK